MNLNRILYSIYTGEYPNQFAGGPNNIIYKLIQNSNKVNYQFDYLSDAITSHLHRFPSVKNGLNAMENNILQLSIDKRPTSKRELLKTVLENQGSLGFGNSQYENQRPNSTDLRFTGFKRKVTNQPQKSSSRTLHTSFQSFPCEPYPPHFA